MAGLLDALRQYISDSMPGGSLNPEQPAKLSGLLDAGKKQAQYIGGLLDPNSPISQDAQNWHKRTQIGLADQLAGRQTPEAEQAYQSMMQAAGIAPLGMTKPLSVAQEFLQQSRDGWSKAIGDSGEFITKKFYPLPITINEKTINFAAHKNSGAGPLHLTRVADTPYGQVLRTYKVDKDGNLITVGDKNLFAMSPEAKQYNLDEFHKLFSSE